MGILIPDFVIITRFWRRQPIDRSIDGSQHNRLLCYLLDTGDGILKLHDDVQTCGYEDVQVMWEMVRRSKTEGSNPSEQRKRRLGGHQPAPPDERPPVTRWSCFNITTANEVVEEEVGGFEQRAAVAAVPPSSSSSSCA